MKPSQVQAILPRLLQSGRVPFIWGDPGIGKSDSVRAVAKAMKVSLVDIRLSLYDPTDLRGFPVIKDGAMHFVPPSLLPTKGKGIILLDEMPAAPPATQNIAYQLVLDRRLGEYEVPKGWHIVGAGNHQRNGGVHHAMAPALANRFVHIDMQADADDWDQWAAANGVSTATRAFLRWKPSLLHDIAQRNSGQAFPTPRSWKFADTVMDLELSHSEEFELVKGTIGEGPAVEYLAFVKTARELPSAGEIFLSPETAPVPESPGARHAVTLMLAHHVGEASFDNCMRYIARLDIEYQTAFMHDIAKNRRELTTSSGFINWCMDNKSVIL